MTENIKADRIYRNEGKWALAKMASFAESHMNEYGDAELLLAVVTARRALGCDPEPDVSDPFGFLDELEAAGVDVDERVRVEIASAIHGWGDDSE